MPGYRDTILVERRIKAIEELLTFSRPLADIKTELSTYPWDYEGHPYPLTVKTIQHVILLFETSRISGEDLVEWADLVEMRDDIEPEAANPQIRDWIIRAVFMLATREINGESVSAIVENIKASFKLVSK